MRKGLSNPNSIQAINEMKTELARELGISDREALETNKNNESNRDINRHMTTKARNNLIGFK